MMSWQAGFGVCWVETARRHCDGKDRPPEILSSIKAVSALAGTAAINAPDSWQCTKAAVTCAACLRETRPPRRALTPASPLLSPFLLEPWKTRSLGASEAESGLEPPQSVPVASRWFCGEIPLYLTQLMKGEQPFPQDTCETDQWPLCTSIA